MVPIYQRIVTGKDLIANVVPPSAYIIEAFLEATVIIKEPWTFEPGRKRLKALRSEYEERYAFWSRQELAPSAARSTSQSSARTSEPSSGRSWKTPSCRQWTRGTARLPATPTCKWPRALPSASERHRRGREACKAEELRNWSSQPPERERTILTNDREPHRNRNRLYRDVHARSHILGGGGNRSHAGRDAPACRRRSRHARSLS